MAVDLFWKEKRKSRRTAPNADRALERGMEKGQRGSSLSILSQRLSTVEHASGEVPAERVIPPLYPLRPKHNQGG